jgi:hypothetical protein
MSDQPSLTNPQPVSAQAFNFALYENEHCLLKKPAMQYTATASTNQKQGRKVVRLSASCMQKLMIESIDLLHKKELWQGLTDILYEGLICDDEGSITIGSPLGTTNSFNAPYSGTVLNSAGLYVNFLKEVSKKYDGLQLVWTLRLNQPDKLLDIHGDRFWECLDQLMFTQAMDGVELDLTNLRFMSRKILLAIRSFTHRSKLWIHLPNNYEWYCDSSYETIRDLMDECRFIILDSFGFMKHCTTMVFGSKLNHYRQEITNDVHDFTRLMDMYLLPADKVIMGVSTLGIAMESDDGGETVCKCWNLAHCQIVHMRMLNQLNIQSRNDCYIKCPHDVECNCTMVSYESQELFGEKLKVVAQRQLAGMVVGYYGYDIDVRNGQSLLGTLLNTA